MTDNNHVNYYLTITCNESYHDKVISFIMNNTANTPYYFEFDRYLAIGVYIFICKDTGLDTGERIDYHVNMFVSKIMTELSKDLHFFKYNLTRSLILPSEINCNETSSNNIISR